MSLRVLILQSANAPDTLDLAPANGVTLLDRLSLSPLLVDHYGVLAADVAVVDLRGVVAGEIGPCLRDLRSASPATRLIVVTNAGDDSATQQALGAGAAAHISRDISPLALLRAVHAVVRGGLHLGPTGKQAIRRLLTPNPADSKR